MVTEPPQYDPAAAQQPPPPPPPPAVPDRRAPERRSFDRRADDRAQLTRTAAAAAMAIAGGLVVLFLFFWALGAIDVKDAVAATVVAVVLALVWLAGFLYRRRQEEPALLRQDRERRGF
jgi:Flp pilus assembly protein TadB